MRRSFTGPAWPWLTLASLLTGAFIAGCGSGGPIRLTTSQVGVVPWISRPAPPYLPSAPLPQKPPATNASPCDAADLRAAQGGRSGLAGSVDFWVKITNVGSTTCIVRGRPRFVDLVSADGRESPLRLAGASTTAVQLEASNIKPGQSAELILNSQLDCPVYAPSAAYREIRIGLPAGGTVTVQGRQSWQFPCPPVGVSIFGVLVPPPVYPPDPLAGLAVRLVLPRAVRTGHALDYEVVLNNPTSRAIPLRPCPGYLEVASGSFGPVKLPYALNCDPASPIAAHHSARFAMVMQIPADAGSGQETIRWALVGPALLLASGSVLIIGPAS